MVIPSETVEYYYGPCAVLYVAAVPNCEMETATTTDKAGLRTTIMAPSGRLLTIRSAVKISVLVYLHPERHWPSQYVSTNVPSLAVAFALAIASCNLIRADVTSLPTRCDNREFHCTTP